VTKSCVRQVQQYGHGARVTPVVNLPRQSRPYPRGGSVAWSSSRSSSAIACSFSASLDPSRLGGRLSSKARYSSCIVMIAATAAAHRQVRFLCSIGAPFLRPDLRFARVARAAAVKAGSEQSEGPPAKARAAVLTTASTAPDWAGSGGARSCRLPQCLLFVLAQIVHAEVAMLLEPSPQKHMAQSGSSFCALRKARCTSL